MFALVCKMLSDYHKTQVEGLITFMNLHAWNSERHAVNKVTRNAT
jgi:hypothetical protein